MSIATAKAFRHEILKPAEGVFLFHARAIERLIEEQFGARVQGVSIPDLPYYLMPRDDFLFGLETENAEALSVIEGLRLPDYVILLPSPAEQRLEERSFRRLRHDYWARGFEAEVARAWQMARDDNRDDWLYGPRALRSLIGDHAFAEVRDVLDRDGATLPIWEDALVCRSFVAMVVRLRYFAPGARGFFFPAVRAWPAVDEWLTASGLDLPDPLQTNRLPMLLVRSRPGGGELPAETPLLPAALPFGASDPDLPGALAAAERLISSAAVPSPDGPAMPVVVVDGSTEQTDADRHLERRCLDALQQGSVVRRRKNWLLRTRDALDALGRRVLGRALFLPGIEDIGLEGGRRAPTAVTRRLRRVLGLTLFKQSVACAQRAEFEGRFASELRYLAEARRLAQRINRPGSRVPESIEGVIAEREASAEEQLADLLAAKWKLSPFHAAEVRALVERLAAEDRGRYGSPSARSLLAHLEQVLSESRSDYYRLRTLSWLLSLGRRRIREILPFQSLLQALGSLQAGQQRLEDLPWPLADLDRFSRALSALTDRVNGRLDAQITPRLERAMREADFVPRNHRETVAAQKMRLELLDVIKLRRHLKFTDVRDIVARNILRLPDPTIDEFFHGDRLRRFDRTAARALPGVYRPGEIYIKGLQQLGAPLFGTNVGRAILRHLLLPLGGAFLLLKSLDLIIEVIPHHDKDFHLTTVSAVGSIGILVNLIAFTGIGRHLSLAIWRFVVSMLRFVLYDGVRMLLRWPPVAQLLKSALIRGLGRNLIQPLLIGTLPLIPIIALAVLVDEVPIEPGLWLVGLAFALGTLLRNTPAGRRFLDNL
ncbi:MAG: sulfite exporter TauE/SafE family protein, partial [Thiohalocapsa sp.]